jgi:hemolysin activation/secretion protein
VSKEKYLKRLQNLDMQILHTLYTKRRKNFTKNISGKHQDIQNILLLAVISADLCIETFNDLFSTSISYFTEESRKSKEEILSLIKGNSDKAESKINEVTSASPQWRSRVNLSV